MFISRKVDDEKSHKYKKIFVHDFPINTINF